MRRARSISGPKARARDIRVVLALAVFTAWGAAGLMMAGAPATAQSVAEGPVLRVSGEGRVQVAPDMAVITLGVQSRAKTAQAALREASGRVASVLEALRGAGIEARDMQTSGLSLGPEWDGSYSDGRNRQRVIGFLVSNTVTVRVRDLAGLGALLDTVVADGANTFNGLQLTSSRMDEHMDLARRNAVAEARRKAALYAEAAGVTLGRLQSLTEAGGGGPRPFLAREMAMADASVVPVAEGEITVSASVDLVYAISE